MHCNTLVRKSLGRACRPSMKFSDQIYLVPLCIYMKYKIQISLLFFSLCSLSFKMNQEEVALHSIFQPKLGKYLLSEILPFRVRNIHILCKQFGMLRQRCAAKCLKWACGWGVGTGIEL